MAAANLLAFVYGVEQKTSRPDVVSLVSVVSVSDVVLSSDVTIAQTDDEYREMRQRVDISRTSSTLNVFSIYLSPSPCAGPAN